MIILGIDPGFAITGYGIVKYEGNKFSAIEYGAVLTKTSTPFEQRLLQIDNELTSIINKYRPDAVSVEELFFNKNIKTAITAAHGRGIALAAAARARVAVFEYTPLQVNALAIAICHGHSYRLGELGLR
jgi:crossover junction endodeoxyribonuclease RuvC